jgi:salicylate hydroxylase
LPPDQVAAVPAAPSGPSERYPIVIAGAGIAGLTAALTLAASGFRVIVAERAQELSEVGAGIQIAPNAGRVLARLGLDKAMARAAIEPEAIDILDGVSGRRLTAVPASAFHRRYGFPYRVIHRADLQSVLAAAVRRVPAVRLHLGTVVEDSKPQADGLLVRLKHHDGGEVVQAAVLVGADGVWSSLRQNVPRSAGPRPIGRTAWRALIAGDVAASLTDMKRVGLWLGPDAHLVTYPVAQGKAFNLVAVVAEQWERPGWNVPGEAAEIREHFAGWCRAARQLIDAPIAWQKYALAPVDPDGPWVSERTALIGDAAHAMVPFLAQGAAMAIEDAAVLAASLYGAGDVAAALRAYEAVRKPRVTRVWRAARQTGDTYHVGAGMGALRNAALTIGGARLVLSRTDWIYRWAPPESGAEIRAARVGR